MTAYDAGQRADFCVAVLGAAAALTGLVFLAVSINLRRILDYPHLPGRAGQTVILFTMPMIMR
jgi:modulator of FtsH protease